MSTRHVRNAAEIRLGGADAAKLWPMTGSNARGLIGPLTTAKAELAKRDSGEKETDAA
jgi:hypothetical protein